jgi:ribosomal protein S12 methylthiotransferase
VDSELMLGALARDGMTLTQDLQRADVVIVNTCGFIESAKQESIDAILRANALRKSGQCKVLIMAGCLTQRYPKDLQKELSEVDAFIGLNEVTRLPGIVHEILERKGEKEPRLYWSGVATFVPDAEAPRFQLTPRHYAYVKIAEGCNHPCTFCSIPRIRGKHRSRQPSDVLAEVRGLVARGVKEINLISQDTTFYGKDLAEGRARLPELLREIEKVEGDFWVRLLYTHPAHWSDELIEAIAGSRKVCRYVDMPLQHINDDVLARMRRETDGAYIRDLVRRLRAGIPGVALRTTFIVGFPGETEVQFQELVEFLQEARFERVGVFAYSQEDHTAAFRLDVQVSPRVKQRRRGMAMAAQQEISREVIGQIVGRTVRVLMDKDGEGRSHMDAPEVDGKVHVRGSAKAGEFVEVRITGASEYDLRGEVVS